MGANTKIIIEFNGLPGCGKSTAVHKLIVFLKNSEYSRIPCFYNRYGRQYHSYSVLFMPCLYPFLLKMTGFSRSVSFSTSHLKYISGITVIVKQYLDFIKNADSGIYLSDQGIIQDLISISYRKEIRELSSLRAVFKSLEKKNLSFLRVDCNLAVDKTLERIGTRLDGGSRLDGMDWDLAKKILNIQSGNFDVVRNTCSEFALGNHLSLDMEDSAEENANKLLASLQL